jgi:hypothetical protein
MDDVTDFIAELLRTANNDGWEQTDTGYQWTSHNYVVKLRKPSNASDIEMIVEGFDGRQIATAAQQPADAAPNEITKLLALLYQRVAAKPVYRVGELRNVLRDLRGQDSRTSLSRSQRCHVAASARRHRLCKRLPKKPALLA